MEQQDKQEILDTLNQYAEQFNSMVQKILTRQADSNDAADVRPATLATATDHKTG